MSSIKIGYILLGLISDPTFVVPKQPAAYCAGVRYATIQFTPLERRTAMDGHRYSEYPVKIAGKNKVTLTCYAGGRWKVGREK